jgi:hypothetical protein
MPEENRLDDSKTGRAPGPGNADHKMHSQPERVTPEHEQQASDQVKAVGAPDNAGDGGLCETAQDTSSQDTSQLGGVDQLLRTFKRRYILALLTIAVMVSASVGVVKQLLTVQEEDAKIINAAGKPRMLSQRIALLVNR